MSEKVPDFTIGMAAYDNFDEVYFTIQSLRFHHQEVIDRFEIVVVDNLPGSREGKAIKAFVEGRVAGGRYVEFPKPKGSVPPRGHLFEVARGRFVICLDSHVLLESGALKCLVDYFDANPQSDDFIQGPLVSNYGPHRLEGSQMRPVYRSQMFGGWQVDERAKDKTGEAFEIELHGLGLFAARRESWLGFNERFSGFSGGEGYIHEKYRQAGRRVLCLPGARWVHKFARPNGIPHNPQAADKIRNHIIGWTELGVDLQTKRTDDPIYSIAEHWIETGKVTPERFSELADECGVEGYKYVKRAGVDGVVIGPRSFGSYAMRGKPVAEKFNWPELNSRARIELADGQRWDTALAVKCSVPPVVRAAVDRVVFDALDTWFSHRKEAAKTPAQWLADQQSRWRFDDVICESVALHEATRRGLKSVRSHLVPHHADPRVGLDWHDPDGPIVYAGAKTFVEPAVSSLTEAARQLGRRIVFDFDHHAWRSLRGASLVLAPRINAKPMDRLCKPTVKVANASQAGIPVLATDDPAVTDLFADIRTTKADDWLRPESIKPHLAKALDDDASAIKFPFGAWLKRMGEILCG